MQNSQKKTNACKFHAQVGERSFTLFETIIALGIMATMMVQLTSVYGNSIYFSEYADNMTKGIWLARRVMSQVEYYWVKRDFSDINEVEETEIPFEGIPDFRYTLTIKDWKLPILDMLSGGGLQGEGEEDKEKSEGGGNDMIANGLSQVLGKELLKVAHVKVSWSEGAKRNDVSLTYLLTNQRKADEAIGGFKAVYDQLQKTSNPSAPPTDPSSGPGSTPPGSPSPTPTSAGGSG